MIFEIFVVFLLTLHHYSLYSSVEKIKKNTLTNRQKSYILSIPNSIILFLVSVYFLQKFVNNGCDISVYKNVITTQEDCLLQLTVLYFTSYLIADNLIGYRNYPEKMTNLSGYPHHIFYIIMNYIILKTGMYHIYILYMIAELPTVIMGLGSYSKKYRRDNLFGFSFFLTRICFHVFMTWLIRNNKIFFGLSLAILPVHIYWFYLWCKSKYNNKYKDVK